MMAMARTGDLDMSEVHRHGGLGQNIMTRSEEPLLIESSNEQLQEKCSFSAYPPVLDMKMDDHAKKLVVRTYDKDSWFEISTWNIQFPLRIKNMTKPKKEWEAKTYEKKYGNNPGTRLGFFRVTQVNKHSLGSLGGEYKQVCMDTTRDLYVATLHYKILLIDRSGKQQRKIRSDPKGPFPFQDLQGIAYSQRQDVYAVTDLQQHCVLIVDAKIYRPISKLGRSPFFHLPYYIIVLSAGDTDVLAVSDTGHHCIKVINMKGDILQVYGESGPRDGQFQIPLGICEGPWGRIIVADHDNNRVVCCWTHSGRAHWQVVLTAGRLPEGHSPRFVATAGEDRDMLFVCAMTSQPSNICRGQHIFIKFTGLTRVLQPDPD